MAGASTERGSADGADGADGADRADGADGAAVEVIRPRRSRVGAWIAAAAVLVPFVVAGIVQTSSGTGVYFRVDDQVSIVAIGVMLAGAILLAARPRVRADADGIEVRNVLGARRLPWTAVRRVAFPDGAPWARLELPYDEYLPVLAIQAIDGQRAVAAIRRVRALHAAAALPPA